MTTTTTNPLLLSLVEARKSRKTSPCPIGRQGSSCFPYFIIVLIFSCQKAYYSKIAWKCFSAGEVSSGEIRPSQGNFASKTKKMLQCTEPVRERSSCNKSIIRPKSLSDGSPRPSRTQCEHISVIKSQTGRQQNNYPCFFSWLYMSPATSLSVSVFISSWFCCHFLFVLHTCDFLPCHHKFPPHKTICTAIATF